MSFAPTASENLPAFALAGVHRPRWTGRRISPGWLPDLNLGPMNYSRVMAEAGGPIARLTWGETEMGGKRRYAANAYLSENLRPSKRPLKIFANADGTGVGNTPLTARMKAISEALERWAYYDAHRSGLADMYGFDVDPSSNGMAAFPGATYSAVKRAARLEAIERHALMNFWEGRCGVTELGTGPLEAYRIDCACRGAHAVVLCRKEEENFYAYGYGAAWNLDGAIAKAGEELERFSQVMRKWRNLGQAPEDLGSIFERRAAFFSTEEGRRLFMSRIRKAPAQGSVPQVVFDGPVDGPWSRYARVWRCVIAPPSAQFYSNDDHYFFW